MHTRLTTDTHCGVYAMKDTEGQRAWVGEVTHPAGETGDEIERRWDAFARLMFAYGVEPAQDDPDHSVLVDGVVTDRYRLREIEVEEP
jgi:hypothetical protein